VSRGYGRDGEGVLAVSRHTPAAMAGDEPLLIHLRTGAPVWVGRDRVAAARALRAAHAEVDVLISDDGLQHRRLARQAEIVVFDGRGIGNGLSLPAGPLRQPWRRAPAPQMLVLYNADAPSTPWPGAMARRSLAGAWLLADWWQGRRAAAAPWASLRGRTLHAAAGLAEPERFFRMLEAQGLTIVRWPLPDHARFHPLPWPPNAQDVLVTEKDAVKLAPDAVGPGRVWVVALDFELPNTLTGELLRRIRPDASPAFSS
jgi:tetraacyldisaccharide 4'-kinase